MVIVGPSYLWIYYFVHLFRAYVLYITDVAVSITNGSFAWDTENEAPTVAG